MDLPKIIILCCIIFTVALVLYIIIKKKDEIKTYILKVDEKITKRNEAVSKKKQDNAKEENEEQEPSKEKNNDTKKEDNTKTKNKQDNKPENEKSAKLKPSKAVEQVRPVLLPPNKENEERDIKLLEMSKRPQMLESSPQKALDFKYGAKNATTTLPQHQQAQVKPKVRNNSSDFISFNKDEDNFNPLKRDVKRQFDDIKNFLELPENQSTMQQKGVSYNGKNFNTVDKIDASLFNSPESHYVDYRNTPKTNSTIINSVNNARAKIENSNAMQAQTKYARNTSTQYGMPSFNLTNAEKNEANALDNEDYALTSEQEDIDLNKLPNNLKKMIIQNILDRRNYDD